MLAELDAVAALPVEEAGGKARGLARLAAAGLPVPAATVLPAAAHRRWVERGELDADDRAALVARAARLRAPLAVRSSAADEDAGDRSAAGQYESVMGVDGEDALVAAVEACYRAAESARARAYRGEAAGGARIALVIQEEVRAGRAGVAFSADPVTGSEEAILVEAVFGHGEGIVAGEVTPDRYRIGRRDRAVRARRADKRAMSDGRGALRPVAPERRLARVLGDDEARAVAALVERAEAGFGRPVDVEFCFDARRLWAVQCRPITTLA